MKRTRSKTGFSAAAAVALLALAGCHGTLGGLSSGNKKVSLWNGRDLTGWERVVSDPAADVNDIWRVQKGVIHCTGQVNGYLRTDKTYRDYQLHVEWRWPDTPANSGVLLHASKPDQVWPPCIECQLKASNAGDFVLMNGTGLAVDGVDRQNSAKQFVVIVKKSPTSERPAGQWNSYDIHCAGDTVRCYVNGTLQNEGTGAIPTFGYIGLQSEGGPIEFRNIYIVPLKP
jgi:hypothetical protein